MLQDVSAVLQMLGVPGRREAIATAIALGLAASSRWSCRSCTRWSRRGYPCVAAPSAVRATNRNRSPR